MKKLYDKSQLGFALAWIGFYCILQSLANPLNELIGVQYCANLAFGLIQVTLLLGFISKHGLLRHYGLQKPCAPARCFLYFIPLIILSTSNLWSGFSQTMPLLDTGFYLAFMLCVGFLEEVIFRGLLFVALAKDSVMRAVVISSVTFGLGHFIHLIDGSGMELAANLFQVIGAIGFGFLFVMLFYRGGSLLPCITAHSAINMLGAFTNEASLSVEHRLAIAIIQLAIIAGYAFILNRTLPNRQASYSESALRQRMPE